MGLQVGGYNGLEIYYAGEAWKVDALESALKAGETPVVKKVLEYIQDANLEIDYAKHIISSGNLFEPEEEPYNAFKDIMAEFPEIIFGFKIEFNGTWDGQVGNGCYLGIYKEGKLAVNEGDWDLENSAAVRWLKTGEGAEWLHEKGREYISDDWNDWDWNILYEAITTFGIYGQPKLKRGWEQFIRDLDSLKLPLLIAGPIRLDTLSEVWGRETAAEKSAPAETKAAPKKIAVKKAAAPKVAAEKTAKAPAKKAAAGKIEKAPTKKAAVAKTGVVKKAAAPKKAAAEKKAPGRKPAVAKAGVVKKTAAPKKAAAEKKAPGKKPAAAKAGVVKKTAAPKKAAAEKKTPGRKPAAVKAGVVKKTAAPKKAAAEKKTPGRKPAAKTGAAKKAPAKTKNT
jgi:hypothetical protein